MRGLSKSVGILACVLVGTVEVQAQSATVTASGSTCASTIAPRFAKPSVAAGWEVHVVASGMKDPRGMVFDASGGLLVVQQERGIVRLNLSGDAGGCVRAASNTTVVDDPTLNHGIELSADGRTLYASSPSSVYAWDYDAAQGRNTSGPREVISQMGGTDGHVTRTLLLSRRVEGMLLVSRGSRANLDPSALDISTGVSTIKAFNVSNVTSSAYNHPRDGLLLGWGLRNSVGIAEHPVTGGVFSVENSVDEFEREGKNIHQNNPGEEFNFHGYLNGTQSAVQGRNFGYPTCYAAWDIGVIPRNQGLQVGMQFAIGTQNATVNDTLCQQDRQAPTLTFSAHTAPLDIKFNPSGSAAWVTFHGSWDRDEPIGYKLSVIGFQNGQPTAPANSSTAAVDIVSNPDLSKCPDQCFRPVGLAWDSQGRLFMSSDATGEIYVVTRSGGGNASEASPTSGIPPAATSSRAAAAADLKEIGSVKFFGALFAAVMALPLL